MAGCGCGASGSGIAGSVSTRRTVAGAAIAAALTIELVWGGWCGFGASVTGRTGSGKTLLLQSICGLLRPSGGNIAIDGRDVTHLEPRDRNLGYMPQNNMEDPPFVTPEDPADRRDEALDSIIPDDPARPTRLEVRTLAGFYGLALPPLKHGIPIRPVQLDNVARFPGYLDEYRVLLLSYEFMKPLSPGIHLALAQWVQAGGSLIYVGADTDPFHKVREWWNRPPKRYRSPAEHLFESLGLSRTPAEGAYKSGKGFVIVERKHPAFFSRSRENGERLLRLLKKAVEAAGGEYVERGSLLLRRGPYVIAACLSESAQEKPLRLKGRFLDLLDPALSVRSEVTVEPGSQAWLIDLERVSNEPPAVLASAGRVEEWKPAAHAVFYVTRAPLGMNVVTRILLPSPPKEVEINGEKRRDFEWDASSRTVLLRHGGNPQGTRVLVTW